MELGGVRWSEPQVKEGIGSPLLSCCREGRQVAREGWS